MMARLEDIPKEIKDLIDTRIKDNPQALQRLDSIIAGSVRGKATLIKRGSPHPPSASSGNERMFQEYIFWQCPSYSESREVYQNICKRAIR